MENENILFSFHTLIIEPSSRRIVSNLVENVLVAIKRDPTVGATCIALSPDLGHGSQHRASDESMTCPWTTIVGVQWF